MARLRKSQLGGINKKNFTGKRAKKSRVTLNPWGGPNLPWRKSKTSKPSGSSRKPATPDPQERGMQYEANKPYQWPVEPDLDNHTLPPSLSGLNSTTIASNNAAVEHAYTRAGYQNSP